MVQGTNWMIFRNVLDHHLDIEIFSIFWGVDGEGIE